MDNRATTEVMTREPRHARPGEEMDDCPEMAAHLRRRNVPAIILSIVLILVILVGGFFLWGRDFITQRYVENEVATQLDKVKAGDMSAIVAATKGRTTFFDDYAIDEEPFLKSLLAGFDYKVGDVVVKGGYIDIAVDVHVKDFGTILSGTATELVSLQTIGNTVSSGSAGLKESTGTALVNATEACDTYMDRTVHVRIIKENGEWKVDNATDIIADLIAGDDPSKLIGDMVESVSTVLDSMSTQLGSFVDNLNGIIPSFTK